MKYRRTPEHNAWNTMMQRCTNPKSKKWKLYGGRGITVCHEWWNSRTFLEYMGPKPSPAHTLERINNDGNYEPGNCKWATRKEQARNTRSTKFIELNGERKPLREWLEIYNLNFETFRVRLRRGWTVERALTEKSNRSFASKNGKQWGWANRRYPANGKTQSSE